VVTETEPVTGNFLESARREFESGDYAAAQKLAHHAVVDEPDNPKAHEMMSLAFFAQGNYAAAAEAARATVSLGAVADWPTLYGYYNDRSKYEQNFNALKQFVSEHQNAPEGRFLLGVHNLMMGHRDTARREFAEYLKLVDHQDPIGIRLYGDAGGDVDALPKPANPAPLPPAAGELEGTR
jgi:tetratricopeptide (TPR) repeat protein